jgi:hypothetical protein
MALWWIRCFLMCPVLVLLLAVPVLLFGFVESPSGFDPGGYVRCGLIVLRVCWIEPLAVFALLGLDSDWCCEHCCDRFE